MGVAVREGRLFLGRPGHRHRHGREAPEVVMEGSDHCSPDALVDVSKCPCNNQCELCTLLREYTIRERSRCMKSVRRFFLRGIDRASLAINIATRRTLERT